MVMFTNVHITAPPWIYSVDLTGSRWFQSAPFLGASRASAYHKVVAPTKASFHNKGPINFEKPLKQARNLGIYENFAVGTGNMEQ